jgi:hypothetical protein
MHGKTTIKILLPIKQEAGISTGLVWTLGRQDKTLPLLGTEGCSNL